MGGVGKTQLAADYARDAWQSGELDVLVWVTASDATAVAFGYAQAGIEVLGADPSDMRNAAAAFLAWLEPKLHQPVCRWLVVLDDVTDPADLRGWWPPVSPHGRTLVTTRRKDAALIGDGRQMLEVGLFDEPRSLAFLGSILNSHDRHEPDAQLIDLAAGLGHLPLALSQAAAYIVDTGICCAAYHSLLDDHTRSLSDAAPDVLPDGQQLATAAAWTLSINRADTLRPAGLARPMLQLAAFMDPNGIPEAVLTSPPALAHLASTSPSRPQPNQVSADQARLALRALYRLSLIDHNPHHTHHTVRVHQLLQQAVRDALVTAQRGQYAARAADALAATWPEIESDTVLVHALRANTNALTACAEDTLYRAGVHPVLLRAGRSLSDAGQIVAARTHFRRLTEKATSRLGADHPDTLAARHGFARAQGTAGDAAGAAAAMASVSADRSRVLGPDHPHTLSARSDLAYWRGRAGDVTGAVAACGELLADRARLLGRDHPDTLTTRQSLAHWQGKAGDATGAVRSLTELIRDRTRVLGPDHPRTLSTRLNLARWQGEAGSPQTAVSALTELLNDYLRILGPDHPHTLITRLNLARWRGEAGDPRTAATELTRLLADYVRVLGPHHIDSLITRRALAHWTGRLGNANHAAADLADVVRDCTRVLGPDDPHTLAARSNLAHWQGRSGDWEGAMTSLSDVLDDCLRVLGPDHPETQAARRRLARWRAGEPPTSS